jgi:hypothetical protein
MTPAAPQETVGEAGMEPGTDALQPDQLVDLTTELPHPHLVYDDVV